MKIVCEVCGNQGQLQHLSDDYYRVKHYLGSVNGKLKFEYHKQSLEHIKGILDTSEEHKNIDPIDPNCIDPNKSNLDSISRDMWTGGDLNPRPPECKSGVHTN
jgi:hypothetical protein